MPYYRISDFSDGPHWDAAIILARTPAQARSRLNQYLNQHETETVWNRNPESQWTIEKIQGPVLFVLGKGCR